MIKINLSERKIQILTTVIRLHTDTCEPVSSKSVHEELGLYSSATIRNEMATLESLGYLKQPHTSAGRVPTYIGYRLYINTLLNKESLTQETKSSINSVLQVSNLNPLHFLSVAVDALAMNTNYTTVVTLPNMDNVTVKGVEFIMINEKTIVATIVFSTANIKNQICKLDVAVSSDVLRKFCDAVNGEIKKRPVSEVTPELVEQLMLTLGAYGLVLAPLMTTVFDLCKPETKNDVIVKGEQNLFNHQDFEFQIENVFEALSDNETVYQLLNLSTSEGTSVIMGEETQLHQMNGSSIVTVKYNFGENHNGSIGVIGPMRMDYGKIIPQIEYFADVISKTLSETIDDI